MRGCPAASPSGARPFSSPGSEPPACRQQSSLGAEPSSLSSRGRPAATPLLQPGASVLGGRGGREAGPPRAGEQRTRGRWRGAGPAAFAGPAQNDGGAAGHCQWCAGSPLQGDEPPAPDLGVHPEPVCECVCQRGAGEAHAKTGTRGEGVDVKCWRKPCAAGRSQRRFSRLPSPPELSTGAGDCRPAEGLSDLSGARTLELVAV